MKRCKVVNAQGETELAGNVLSFVVGEYGIILCIVADDKGNITAHGIQHVKIVSFM